MNIAQAFLAMDACFAADITPHFIGLHGIGKSAMVYQYAESRGYRVEEIRVGLMADAGDLVGIQEFVKDLKSGEAVSTKHILPSWFMEAVVKVEKSAKAQTPVIIFIDELNRGHKDLLQAIFELVYDRSLKGTKMRKGCQVVAASNPPTGNYQVLDFNDSAFQDRFCHIKLEPSVEEWLKYARETQPQSAIADFIAENPLLLEDKNLEAFDLSFVKPSRRSNIRIALLEKTKPNPEIELELYMGIIGLTPALAYMKFRETNYKSIKADVALNDYAAVKKDVLSAIAKDRKDSLGTLVEEIGALLATMDKLTMNQADNLAELTEDLPAESQFALALVVKSNQQCTMNIENFDTAKMCSVTDYPNLQNPEKLGMFAHKSFVKTISYVRKQRDIIKASEAPATATATP